MHQSHNIRKACNIGIYFAFFFKICQNIIDGQQYNTHNPDLELNPQKTDKWQEQQV